VREVAAAPGPTEPWAASASASAATATAQQAKKEPEPIPIEEEPPITLNDRDIVQTMVRDNPEMAVAIIGKWLQTTR